MRDQSKPQQSSTTKYDMNDCLLESENFQITKSDNNKYLLLPVKKQQPEKFVLKECGKDFDNRNLLSLTHTHTHISFLFSRIKFARKTRNYLSPQPSTHISLFMFLLTWGDPGLLSVPEASLVRSHHHVFSMFTEQNKKNTFFKPRWAERVVETKQEASMNFKIFAKKSFEIIEASKAVQPPRHTLASFSLLLF